jgi:WD40 repeat protein
MRFRPSFLGIFAVILSCGPAPEGPPDTVAVGSGTQPAAAATAAAAAALVGFSGSRFAVLDAADATVVFDADARSAFRIDGQAIRTPYIGSDMWMDVNLTGNEPTSKLEASADGRRILVRTAEGIQAVDLSSHDAPLASDEGGASAGGATMAPDGEAFATWNDEVVTVVRIRDGARVAYPITPLGYAEPTITWTSKSVSWADADGASLVDRATGNAHHIAMDGATLVVSKDGGIAAAYRDGVVELWRAGESSPAAHVASAFAANLIMDATGSKAAWVEHSGKPEERAYLHTLDVASGAHARFAAQAAHCELSPESLVAIENGKLQTDGECSPGCPSISRQPDYLAYAFDSGRVLRHWMGDAEPPYNDELSVRSFAAEQLAKRYGFREEAPLPIVHHPSHDVVLVEGPDALRLADVVSGDELAVLLGSVGFPASSAHFWPGTGALVVGARAGSIAIWNAATGERVWSTGH